MIIDGNLDEYPLARSLFANPKRFLDEMNDLVQEKIRVKTKKLRIRDTLLKMNHPDNWKFPHVFAEKANENKNDEKSL